MSRDNVEQSELERAAARMKAAWEAAGKSRLSLFQLTPRTWAVVRLDRAVGDASGAYYLGHMVYGPDTRLGCESYLALETKPPE